MEPRSVRRLVWRWLRAWRGALAVAVLLAAAAVLLARQTTAFGRPEALVGLVTVSMLLLLLGYDGWWRESARRRFAEVALLKLMGEPSLAPALGTRALLLTGALTLMMLAAARPKGGLDEALLTGEGIDLVLCLDVSNSMRAQDMGGRPRLAVAKELLTTTLDRRAGDRFALIGFAGSAHTMCPFTIDTDTLGVFLEDLDYGSVAEQGTAIGAALREALSRFDPKAEAGQAILLLTDGEDQGTEPLAAAEACRERGVVVYCVGLGSPDGSRIPMGLDFWGNPIVKRYQGAEVTTRLDETTLRSIVTATGGAYLRADSPRRIEEVLAEIDKMDQRVVRAGKVELRQDVFWWYLIAAVVLLALEPLLLVRSRRARW